MIEAKIIKDSISESGKRIISFELVYPRFIHSELMTHRVFSRNAASSRAIPVSKTIEDIRKNIAMPIHWGKNQPGMQANEECDALIEHFGDPNNRMTKEAAWAEAAELAIDVANAFSKAGYHKQIVNRLLEPFLHMRVLVTATEWDNFFELRTHPDAQPEFQDLAKKMYVCYTTNEPTLLKNNEWHLPYIDSDAIESVYEFMDSNRRFNDVHELLRIVSASRCARVSYKTHENKVPKIEDDIKLYDMLVTAKPMHASPVEHQATPDIFRDKQYRDGTSKGWQKPELHGNFVGWIQYRKLLERN